MEENQNQNQNPESGAASGDSLKDEWKGVGKGLGKTFMGLGKTVIKTAKVGIEKADNWAEGKEDTTSPEDISSMKEGWKTFGHNFVNSAEDFGKTGVKTAKAGAEMAQEWAAEEKKETGNTGNDGNNE